MKMANILQLFLVFVTVLKQSPFVGCKCRGIAKYKMYDCEAPWQAFEDNCYLFVSQWKSYKDA